MGHAARLEGLTHAKFWLEIMTGRDHLEDLRLDWQIHFKMHLKEMICVGVN